MKTALKKLSLTSVDSQSISSFNNEIAARYNPLIYSMKKEYWNRLSLPAGELEKWIGGELSKLPQDMPVGDIIMSDGDTLYFYKFVPAEKTLYAGIIGRKNDTGLSDFCKTLSDTAKTAGIGVSGQWENVSYDNEALESIYGKSQTYEPTKNEIEAARFLENDSARKLLNNLNEVMSSSVATLVAGEEGAELEPIVDNFEKMNIVTKDFVVLCSKTGQPILKVSSRSALEGTAQGANKCFICGNPLSRETIDEVISSSDFGKRLIENDYWLQVRFLSALEKAGVPFFQANLWSDDRGLIYVFSVINSQSYLFVLCNRTLTLDDVHYINVYLGAYGIQHSLIVSTEKIPVLMKHYVQQSNPETIISFIDSLVAFDEAVELFLIEQDRLLLSDLLKSFSIMTPVNINKLVMAGFGVKPLFEEKKETGAKEEKVSGKKPAAPPKAEEKPTAPEKEKREKEPAAEPVKPAPAAKPEEQPEDMQSEQEEKPEEKISALARIKARRLEQQKSAEQK